MDKYNIIFVKTAFSQTQLLGRKVEDYVLREFSSFCASKSRLSKNTPPTEDMFLDGYINVVLTLDMPLVTVNDVLSAVKDMKDRGIGTLSLGKRDSVSKICTSKCAQEGVFSPKLCFFKIDDAKSFNVVYNLVKESILDRLLADGVQIVDKTTTFVDDTVTIQKGVKVLPFCRIEGNSALLGEASVAGSYIKDSVIDGASVEYSHVVDSRVGARSTIGPYARLRGAIIENDCRIGDFVEVKSSTLANGVKASHLSYVGNAEVGEHTNVGCGTVFCNYDGVNKHKTTVGANCFLGANTNLIAPVVIGDDSFVAAGTTVTRDVEGETFTIGRVRQNTKPKR